MLVINGDVTIRMTAHFEAQARARELSSAALFACVVAEAQRLMVYQGCRLALDFGRPGIAVVKVEPGHLELLTALAPGQFVMRSDTLRVRVANRRGVAAPRQATLSIAARG